MLTEIIILAQGTQQRLGMAHGFKQLLKLPGCGDAPILHRTIQQVLSVFGRRADARGATISVVAWEPLARAGEPWISACPHFVRTVELADPGNSSLKGIARYLEAQQIRRQAVGHTIVLLGDVVYSWACLSALFDLSRRTAGFVGTTDLSGAGGELWGVAWHRERDDAIMTHLRDALLRHPPFEDDYQPGQLRRWISGFQRGDLREHVDRLRRRGEYIDVDDYTRDIDLPSHVAFLPALSEAARVDDAKHGLTWGAP